MSILIKGMEMPTSCARCRCAKGCPAVNDRIAQMDEHPWFPCDHRHEDCPLVPVPPHGRLGDLDTLAGYIHQQEDWLSEAAIHAFCGILCKMPTIIPAEEGET